MLKIASITDPGLVRSNNEDFYLYSREKRIIIIADGVGGYDYGEVASRIASESSYSMLESELDDSHGQAPARPEDVLSSAIRYANQAVLDAKVSKPQYKKMGTTLSCIHTDDSNLYFSYIGDSRVYLIQGQQRQMHLLTRDHTLNADLLDQTAVPGLYHNASHILTRMVGAGLSVNPEQGRHAFNSGDYILACTDGLSDLLSSEVIMESVLACGDDLDRALLTLVDKVKQEGARDNVTIVMAYKP